MTAKILTQAFLLESFDSRIHDFVVCKRYASIVTFALSIIYTYWTLEDEKGPIYYKSGTWMLPFFHPEVSEHF